MTNENPYINLQEKTKKTCLHPSMFLSEQLINELLPTIKHNSFTPIHSRDSVVFQQNSAPDANYPLGYLGPPTNRLINLNY